MDGPASPDTPTVMFNIVALMSVGYALHAYGPLASPAQRGVLGMFVTDLALPCLLEDFLAVPALVCGSGSPWGPGNTSPGLTIVQ